MSTFGFRSLVLGVITSILVTATGLLAWLAYNTVYDQILLGFDRKLLAISGTVGALTDGTAHAEYQRPYAVTRMVAGPEGSAWGWGATRSTLVRIDLATSAVVERRPMAWRPRAMVWIDTTQRLLLQTPEGQLVEAPESEGAEQRVVEAGPVEGIWVSDGESLLRWDGERILRPALPAGNAGEEGSVTEPTELRPPEPVGLLARDIDGARWIGWNAAASRLIAFGDDGVLQASADLDLAARPVFGLAVEGGQVYLAADALLRYDWTEGVLAEDFSPGYYNEEDEFVARHAPWYRSLRERARLTFLYTEVFLGGDQIRYVLDGSTGDDHSPPGYLDTVPEEDIDAVVRAQVEGTPFVSGIREWEIWGLVKVSAAPIRDVTGKVVALAGADVDIGVIRSKTRNALFAVLGVGGVLMLVSGLVSLSVAQTITRPLRDIKNAALRIAAGQYGQRLQNATADDIGRLAGSLDRLSLRLHEQEEASSASQAELLTGRLDEAVRASLLTDPSQPSRVRVLTASGWLVAEFAALHEGGATEHAIAAGRLQVLARRLAELGTLRADALFAATPQLRWLLIWDPASQQVQWESQKVALHARDAQGGEQTLAAGLHALDAEVRVLMVDGEVIVQRGTEA